MALALAATPQAAYNFSGLITLTSGQAYDAASPTATKPSTTSQSALLYDTGTNYPNLIKIVPSTSANNFTSVGMRVIGWSQYIATSGSYPQSATPSPQALSGHNRIALHSLPQWQHSPMNLCRSLWPLIVSAQRGDPKSHL